MDPTPRIHPLPPDERDEQTAELLASMRFEPDGEDMNLFATLARHPRLLKRWSAFGGTLLMRGTLPARDREVLIMRTAANCGADYEWGHHLSIAAAAGLTDDEVASLTGAAEAAADPLLVQAADELHNDGVISDATWEALAARYDEQQLIEIPMVVGQYHLVAFTLRSLRIQPEPGVAPMPR